MHSERHNELCSPARVRELLKALDVVPSKVLGQNFLIDANIRRILLEHAGIGAGDRVLEIGAGLGVLTDALLDAACSVTAIEKDRRLAAHLAERFAHRPSFSLVCADALDGGRLAAWLAEADKLVSNLPYAAGSRILMDTAVAAAPPARVVVTVQDEVAERLAARTGTKTFGLLSLWVQLAFEVSVVKRVSRSCFWPQPAVTSSIVVMDRRPAPVYAPGADTVLRRLSKHAFAHRRKQMTTILAAFPNIDPAAARARLSQAGIAPQARPETVPADAWVRLANALTTCG